MCGKIRNLVIHLVKVCGANCGRFRGKVGPFHNKKCSGGNTQVFKQGCKQEMGKTGH